MNTLWIIFGIAAFLAAAVILAAYICYRIAFYSDRKKNTVSEVFDLPRARYMSPITP